MPDTNSLADPLKNSILKSRRDTETSEKITDRLAEKLNDDFQNLKNHKTGPRSKLSPIGLLPCLTLTQETAIQLIAYTLSQSNPAYPYETAEIVGYRADILMAHQTALDFDLHHQVISNFGPLQIPLDWEIRVCQMLYELFDEDRQGHFQLSYKYRRQAPDLNTKDFYISQFGGWQSLFYPAKIENALGTKMPSYISLLSLQQRTEINYDLLTSAIAQAIRHWSL